MVNKNLFASTEKMVTNHAGGKAYLSPEKEAIAQIACTGCFNDTFYSTAEEQLNTLQGLCQQVVLQPSGEEFLAKVAIYSRVSANMKDMPAYICALLASRKTESANRYLKLIFNRCIDNGKQLRNFVKICRSNVFGKLNISRRSIKTLINKWFDAKSSNSLFNYSIGNDPSLESIIKGCHVKPNTKEKEALFGYLLGREYSFNDLPELAKDYELFKVNSESMPVPKDLDFRFLDGICSKSQMKDIWQSQLDKGNWHVVRMNLNNLLKYGVLDDSRNLNTAVRILSDREAIQRSKVFPYQIFTTYKYVSSQMPREVINALHDALEISLHNVPKFENKLYICIDVSGSMGSPITGNSLASSAIRCVDVAGLITAALLKNNPSAEVIPFNYNPVEVKLEPRDSVMTNTQKLANLLGGGTDCSSPLKKINSRKVLVPQKSTIILVSDNESWFNEGIDYGIRTQTFQEWKRFLAKNPGSSLVCLDLTPNETSLVKSSSRVLKVGGFSDAVFDVIQKFSDNSLEKNNWLSIIDDIKI